MKLVPVVTGLTVLESTGLVLGAVKSVPELDEVMTVAGGLVKTVPIGALPVGRGPLVTKVPLLGAPDEPVGLPTTGGVVELLRAPASTSATVIVEDKPSVTVSLPSTVRPPQPPASANTRLANGATRLAARGTDALGAAWMMQNTRLRWVGQFEATFMSIRVLVAALRRQCTGAHHF